MHTLAVSCQTAKEKPKLAPRGKNLPYSTYVKQLLFDLKKK